MFIKKLLLVVAALLSAGAAPLSAVPLVGEPEPKLWKINASYNTYLGDYGTDEETDIRIIHTKLTRYFSWADASITFPIISVSGQSAVTLAGRRPIAVEGGEARTVETTSGIGDMVASLHGIFLEEKDNFPEVGGTVFVKFPTAEEKKGLGTGEFDEGARLEFYKSLPKEFFGFFDLGYTFVGDPQGFDYNDRWLASLGIGHPLGKKLSVSTYYTEERAFIDGEENARDITFIFDFNVNSDSGLFTALLFGLSDGSPDTGFAVGGRLRFANPFQRS